MAASDTYGVVHRLAGDGSEKGIGAFFLPWPKNSISKRSMESAVQKILPLCESWKNAVLPKSIKALEIIRGKKSKSSKQSGKTTTKITTFDTLFL